MPIENENKYVLKSSETLEIFLRENLKQYEGHIYEIQQAYIGKEGRIRKKTITHYYGHKLEIDHLFPEENEKLIFTYKHRLSKRKGALELEMNMTQDDFKLAWEEEKNVCLIKTRITLNMPWNEAWEIDFFKHNNYTYLLLAECELKDRCDSPIKMPDIVRDNLLYVVPENDPRFKNRNLTDPQKVSELIELISREHSYGQTPEFNETLSL